MKLRREDSRLREQRIGGVDGAVLGPRSFVLRYFAEGNDDRLVLVNFGEAQLLEPMPEPLLAPPVGFEWATLWSSESERYGGPGAVALPTQDSWTLPGEAAVVLQLVRERAPRRKPKKRG
jgi:maltooligosyltrehalose trehalohydrolase